VLVAELTADDPHREFSHLSAGCCDREIWARSAVLAAAVLVEVLGYVEGERAHAVRRARQAGRYERLEGAGGHRGCWAQGGCGFGRSMIGRKDVSLDALDPAARRRLLSRAADGLEPAALWLNEDGAPRDPHVAHCSPRPMSG
jgi:hypothetical protein